MSAELILFQTCWRQAIANPPPRLHEWHKRAIGEIEPIESATIIILPVEQMGRPEIKEDDGPPKRRRPF